MKVLSLLSFRIKRSVVILLLVVKQHTYGGSKVKPIKGFFSGSVLPLRKKELPQSALHLPFSSLT